jgi:hypothetical protein
VNEVRDFPDARLWTACRCRKGPSFPSLARNQCEVAACRSPFPFRLFELEEINAPTSVAGDQFVIVDEGTGRRRAITSKRGERCSAVQVPHLQRVVPRRGHRPLPVRTQCAIRRSDHILSTTAIAHAKSRPYNFPENKERHRSFKLIASELLYF